MDSISGQAFTCDAGGLLIVCHEAEEAGSIVESIAVECCGACVSRGEAAQGRYVCQDIVTKIVQLRP
jgi:hypothetical protein